VLRSRLVLQTKQWLVLVIVETFGLLVDSLAVASRTCDYWSCCWSDYGCYADLLLRSITSPF
jgi:hypothetical protein